MTLEELADAMIALGAYEAMNFDGGGSTALVVRDSLVNAPSDTSGERAVGNAVVVTRRAADAGNRSGAPCRGGTGAWRRAIMPMRRDTAAASVPPAELGFVGEEPETAKSVTRISTDEHRFGGAIASRNEESVFIREDPWLRFYLRSSARRSHVQ